MVGKRKYARTLVCNTVASGVKALPGSKQTDCDECGCRVWFSPASRERAGQEARIVCLDCLEDYKKTTAGPYKVMPPTEAQYQEGVNYCKEVMEDKQDGN